MKPMGTITKYYPFIDEESKTILDSLMKDTSSYYDFVQSLCHVVLESDVPTDLAYIAAIQAWWCRLEDEIGLINQKFKDVPHMVPWGNLHASLERDQIRFHDAIVRTIEQLVEESTDDWILTELHLLHAHFHWPISGDIPSQLEPVGKARELIDANPLLKCFEAQACFYEGWAKRIEGEIEDAIAIYQRGIELAEAHDESLHMFLNLEGQGDAIKNVSIKKAIALFEEAYQLTLKLEVPYLEAEVLHDSGLVFEVAGEYDLAISSYQEMGKVYQFDGSQNSESAPISRVYVALGNGERALEMAIAYLEDYDVLGIQWPYLGKAAALALLNRVDEAEANLAEAYKLVIKSGLDRFLGRYYLAAGLVELAKGDYLSSMDYYEKAWEIFERVGQVYGEKNLALTGLARAEILLDSQTSDVKKTITPGRWLSNLEKFAIERDLPGIRMQAALLKSQFFQNHGRLKDAQATLQDALSITESKGVATLRKKISEQINEIEKLVRDEEIVS
ncbi:MAG: tetratricopeptide repeat protein [Candidatus Thorarchaeota archaeon]|jgi:tetratricopeptide (TPR) repeat protein